jgi:hypothetical protein
MIAPTARVFMALELLDCVYSAGVHGGWNIRLRLRRARSWQQMTSPQAAGNQTRKRLNLHACVYGVRVHGG